jgi:hypothetical protein
MPVVKESNKNPGERAGGRKTGAVSQRQHTMVRAARTWDDAVREAGQGSLLTPTRGGFADATSAILRYPYRTGAV